MFQRLTHKARLNRQLWKDVEACDFDNVAHLVAQGADINHQRLSDGSTILHAAIRGGISKITIRLLEIEGIDVTVRDDDGNTALEIALLYNKYDVAFDIKEFIARQAAVAAPDEAGSDGEQSDAISDDGEQSDAISDRDEADQDTRSDDTESDENLGDQGDSTPRPGG